MKKLEILHLDRWEYFFRYSKPGQLRYSKIPLEKCLIQHSCSNIENIQHYLNVKSIDFAKRTIIQHGQYHNHFTKLKWGLQNILKNGLLFPLGGSYSQEKQKVLLHPGGMRQFVAQWLEWDYVPVLYNYFDISGYYKPEHSIPINNFEDLFSVLPKRSEDTIYLELTDFDKIDADGRYDAIDYNKPPTSSIVAHIHRVVPIVKDSNRYNTGFDDLFDNSFPLKIYVGSKNKEDFALQKNRIIERTSQDKTIFSGRTSQDQIIFSGGKRLDLQIISMSDSIKDILSIPYRNKYKGIAIYCNSEIEWKKNILELLFFVNNEKSISMYNMEKLTLFNCEHDDCLNLNPKNFKKMPDWWFTEMLWTNKERIGLLPEIYGK